MKIYYKFMAWLAIKMGRNTKWTPKEVIKTQLQEPRALPLGVTEFHEWSERIISGAVIPGATVESQKFALADMLLHMGPTVDHESDVYFIKVLRKTAVNQVADAMRAEIRDRRKAQMEAEKKKAEAEAREKEKKAKLEVVENPGEVAAQTPAATDGKEILRNS